MEHLKEISQKPQMRPFRADFLWKKFHEGVSSILYQTVLKTMMSTKGPT